MNPYIQLEQTERTEREGRASSVSSGSNLLMSDARNAGRERVGAGAAHSIRKHFVGHVSKPVLLTRLLPLSVASLFGALGAAAVFYPTSFDWRVQVISSLTSPYDNARGCWLAALGVMAGMFLISPFAGYVAARLHAIALQPARSAGTGFALSFFLTFLAVALQLAQPVIGLRWLHGILAGAAALSFIAAMFCCSACALQVRLRRSDGSGPLSGALVFSWLSLTLLPIVCLAAIGVLMLLGRHAGFSWAEDFRQSFRHTALWNLAFWEWIGVAMGFVFMAISVSLLPATCGARSIRSGRTSSPAGASVDSLLRRRGGHDKFNPAGG